MTAIPEEELENRGRYHPPSPEKAAKHEEMRAKYLELARYVNEMLPPSREAEMALTYLLDSSLWAANAALARRD